MVYTIVYTTNPKVRWHPLLPLFHLFSLSGIDSDSTNFRNLLQR